jgi:hypothetical protein
MRALFIRILEAILCRQYWQEHDPGRFPGEIDEKWCKIASVQADLSMLKGWDLLFQCLPAILLTIPNGIVADKYGRKMLLFIVLRGVTLATAWMQIVGKFVIIPSPARMLHFSALAIFSERPLWFRAATSPKHYP